MEPDKKTTGEAKEPDYKLESDIDTPAEELKELRTSSKRESVLLAAAAVFIIGLGVAVWWFLSQDAALK